MTRRKRIALVSTGVVLSLLATSVVVAIVTVRSGWLRDKIRARIVEAAETATGGRVEIGALQIDWRALTAEIDNLVIHGTEPPGAAPLLSVKRVVIGFKIISFLERQFNVARVEADDPNCHVIIEADGSTNLPQPKVARRGNIAQTILDLKIGKFDLNDGSVDVEQTGGSRSVTPWSGHGENLGVNVSYSRRGPRYDGKITIARIDFAANAAATPGMRVTAQLTAAVSLERNRLRVSAATLKSGQSRADLEEVVVDNFRSPVTTGKYRASLSLSDADRIFKFVNFRHTGTVRAEGTLRFASTADFLITGAIRGSGLGYGNVRDMRMAGNLSATPGKVLVNALLVNALGGELRATGEVRKLEDFHLAGTLSHFDVRQLADLGGVEKLPYDAVVSGPFDATGKLRESDWHRIMAGATLEVTPAEAVLPVRGELTAKYDGASGTVELGKSWLQLPGTRIDFAGVLGQRLDVKLQSRNVNDLSPLVAFFGHDLKAAPAALNTQRASVEFDGSISGPFANPRFAGHGTILNALYEGQTVDSLTGDFTAARTRATVSNASLVSNNLRARFTGSIGLTDWKPVAASAVSANAQITNADIARLLALAGQKNWPASGTLTTNAQISGTVGDPRATADLTLLRGQIYGEPFDSITGHAQYLNSGAQLLTAAVSAGRKRIDVNGRFEHPDKLTFSISSNAMAINQIALVRKNEPNLLGTAQIKADGVVRIDLLGAKKHMDVLDLNGDLRATGLALGPRGLGDAHLTAHTANGIMTARFDSSVAKATIRGEGTVRLSGDYPINSKLTFSDLALSAMAALIQGSSAGLSKELNLDGSAAGQVTLAGPATMPDQLSAAVEVTEFELHPITVSGDARNIPNLRLKNSGPLRATLAKSTIVIDDARFQAPQTDLALTGAIALRSQSPLDLRVQGNMNLALAQSYNADLTSSGELNLNAAVRGSFNSPDISGRAELQKGDFHYAEFTNGLTNTNGLILFNGKRATIQSLTAESGGGRVDATGFAALTGGLLAFRLEAKTRGVRVRYPEGVSTISDSDLTLAGTSARSEASGTVTVRRVSINPKSDISTILAGASQPMRTSASSKGVLENMNLDIQVETAPDVAFETSVAQSLEADANLRLRGTAANPAVLGRINVTQGQLSFFGNKYTINQGSISFFNPARIDPVLNVDLETKARGVDVIITVSGPLTNLNASYRSDPPLQFSDVVALLATGRTPTDPTLAIRSTGQSQSLQQMGASALIGEAISNPVGGRLQRFFGVSNIKIDPQITGITGSPEARVTIEQQISPELLFTYINDVSSTSTQLIRVEWDFNRRWAAILTREENGYVSVDFAFKKRFK